MAIKAAHRDRLIIVAMLMLLLGCSETMNHEDKVMASTAQISAAEWQALTQKRIVFGHQSVGRNILTGVRSLAAKAGANLPVVESRKPVAGGGITHFSVGQNEDPLSKIADFTSTLDNGAAQGVDIALMKLCYVDFKDSTPARQIAEQYSTMLDRLSQKFPNTTFVAVTAPLTIVQTGPKAWIKRLLGRMPSGYIENVRRQEFNDFIRARYGQQGLLFDLAKIEADGAVNAPEYQGRPIEVLNPTLTHDGGHLNTHGEKKVAVELIKFLAVLPSR